MTESFGSYIRKKRESLLKESGNYSLRKVAAMIIIQPSYLSKLERGDVLPPSEATIIRLAEALKEDPDVLLAIAGKVRTEFREAIKKRPQLFADVMRQLVDAPDHVLLRIAKEAREGKGTSDTPAE